MTDQPTTRRGRAHPPGSLRGAPSSGAARAEDSATDASDRRVLPRHPVHRPLLVVPVLPNGTPDWGARTQGVVMDASQIGVGLLLECYPDAEVREIVLALPGADGRVRCAGLEIHRCETLPEGPTEVGAQIGGFADQLFRPENLTPTYQPHLGGFGLGLPEELLEAWAAVGLLQPRVFDRVLVCPRCRALPTFRRGCSNCGAAVALSQDRLVHHFACAYVGAVDEFQGGEELQCPKCRTRQLVVGTDYEYLSGMHRCADCHWSGDEPGSVAHCLGCQLRFPAEQAVEIDLKGYHGERLDLLALAAAS